MNYGTISPTNTRVTRRTSPFPQTIITSAVVIRSLGCQQIKVTKFRQRHLEGCDSFITQSLEEKVFPLILIGQLSVSTEQPRRC